MTGRMHPEAEAEYIEAIGYYRRVQRDLAADFVHDVERGILAVEENPLAYPEVGHGIRRYTIRRFPYGVFYRVQPNGAVLVVGVGHLKRRAGYWRGRLT